MKGGATKKFVMSEEYLHKTPKRSVQMDHIDDSSASNQTLSDNGMEFEPMNQENMTVQNESICDNQVADPSSAIVSVIIENDSQPQESRKNDSNGNGMNGGPSIAIVSNQLNGIEENMDIDSNDSIKSLNGNSPMELCDPVKQATAASSNPIATDDIEIDSRSLQNDHVLPATEIGTTVGDSVSSTITNASKCESADDESSSIDSFHGFSNEIMNVAFETQKMVNVNVCNIGQGNGFVSMVATPFVNNSDTNCHEPSQCDKNEPTATETIDHGELFQNLNSSN